MTQVQPTSGGDQSPSGLERWISYIARALSASLNFGTTMSNKDPDNNMQAWKFTGTAPGAADTDFTLPHSLNRVPIIIDGQDTTNGGLIYRSPVTPWTATACTFRCTKASSVYRIIVI
jgi:hypothetical protein